MQGRSHAAAVTPRWLRTGRRKRRAMAACSCACAQAASSVPCRWQETGTRRFSARRGNPTMRSPGGRAAVAVRNRVNEKHANLSSRLACFRFARPEGFEPPTFWSVAKRSIQLSQGRTSIDTRRAARTKYIISRICAYVNPCFGKYSTAFASCACRAGGVQAHAIRNSGPLRGAPRQGGGGMRRGTTAVPSALSPAACAAVQPVPHCLQVRPGSRLIGRAQ